MPDLPTHASPAGGLADSLYNRLRSLERRGGAGDADFRRMIDDFYRAEPAVRAAMPAFSTFALLEAIRKSKRPEEPLVVGGFTTTTARAIATLNRLSAEDVSTSYPWYDPNNSHFIPVAGGAVGLLFFLMKAGHWQVGLVLGFFGGFVAASLAAVGRYLIRNSTKFSDRPQWICALHVDRYLQAHHRGAPLARFRIEDLPNPGCRRKAPFYALHNQITHGLPLAFPSGLRDTPELTFAPEAPPRHES